MVSTIAGGHHQVGLFRASIPRFNSSLPAQFPAMFIKIAGKCDIAVRTSNPNALSIRFSDGRMLLPAERARFQRFLFHRSDLLKHLHASHGVVSRRAHITVRKSNDRVPCAIVVDLQCIAMRLGFRAVNPLARPAASLPAEPVVTPCGYNITNAVRISCFPDAPAPSCFLVNVNRSALSYSLTSHTSASS